MEQNIQDNMQQMKLPKNIRQIGIVDKGNRVYIEDYVVTYMKRILREKKCGFGAVALYGQVFYLEKTKYVFIQAAAYQALEEYEAGLNKETTAYFRQQAEQYFPDLSPVGIAILHSKENRIPGAWYQKSKLAGLLGRGAVFIDFIEGNTEAEYSFLLEDGMQILDGHFIYYEKNEIMQNYLIDFFERGKLEQPDERDEEVSESCKLKLSEKKDERGQGVSSLCFSMSSVCLFIGMCVVGLVVLGYYQKAKDSSSADVSISTVSQENAYELTDVLNLSGLNDTSVSSGNTDAVYLDPNLDPNQSMDSIPVEDNMIVHSGDVQGTTGQNADSALDDNLFENENTDALPDMQSTSIDVTEAESTNVGATDARATNNGASDVQNQTSSGASDAQSQTSSSASDAQSQTSSSASDAQSQTNIIASDAQSQTSSSASDAQSQTSSGASDVQSQTSSSASDVQNQTSSDASGATSDNLSAENITYSSYEIERGDTLYDICMKRYGSISNMSLICNLNGIENQNNIYYGQTIVLP
ncbi:MAG: LysM peptidoglycan-binding domain-containing protein [Lachnospiraceae bacterium]